MIGIPRVCDLTAVSTGADRGARCPLARPWVPISPMNRDGGTPSATAGHAKARVEFERVVELSGSTYTAESRGHCIDRRSACSLRTRGPRLVRVVVRGADAGPGRRLGSDQRRA